MRNMSENNSDSGSDDVKNNLCNGKDDDDVCRDFLRNVCRRGKRCKYRHPPANGVSENGTGAGGVGEGDHNHNHNMGASSKPEPTFCHDFQNTGCHRPTCKFLHCTREEEELFHQTGQLPQRLHQTSQSGGGGGSGNNADIPVCRDFMKGECKRGAKCKYRHLNNDFHNDCDPILRNDVGGGPGPCPGRPDMPRPDIRQHHNDVRTNNNHSGHNHNNNHNHSFNNFDDNYDKFDRYEYGHSGHSQGHGPGPDGPQLKRRRSVRPGPGIVVPPRELRVPGAGGGEHGVTAARGGAEEAGGRPDGHQRGAAGAERQAARVQGHPPGQHDAHAGQPGHGPRHAESGHHGPLPRPPGHVLHAAHTPQHLSHAPDRPQQRHGHAARPAVCRTAHGARDPAATTTTTTAAATAPPPPGCCSRCRRCSSASTGTPGANPGSPADHEPVRHYEPAAGVAGVAGNAAEQPGGRVAAVSGVPRLPAAGAPWRQYGAEPVPPQQPASVLPHHVAGHALRGRSQLHGALTPSPAGSPGSLPGGCSSRFVCKTLIPERQA